MSTMDRRTFLSSAVIGSASSFFLPPARAVAGTPVPQDPAPARSLITRKLGKTGIELPIVSMGVMRADSPGLVRAAIKAGIRHFDTAHDYQGGNNEAMLGRVLKEYARDSYVIATKVGAMSSPERFFEKVDLSLKRLQVSFVDILYLHSVSSREGALDRQLLETVQRVKSSGKARFIGISTHRNEHEVVDAAREGGVIDVVLTSVNFRQSNRVELRSAIAKAAAAGVGIIAMKTMAGSLLDKLGLRSVNHRAALKWALQNADITTSIPGITSYEELVDNASVNEDLTLTPEEMEDISSNESGPGLYCTGCDTCTRQCRRNLPIPDLMRAYMYTYGYRNPAQARELLAALAVHANPCADCTSCLVSCRQGFDVRERIADVSRLTEVPAEFFV